MKIHLYLLSLICACSIQMTKAQGWEFVIDNPDYVTNQFKNLIATEDGNYIASGYILSTAPVSLNGTNLVKFNEQGEIIWERYLPIQTNPGIDRLYEISGDRYLVFNRDEIQNEEVSQLRLLNQSGEIIWDKYYYDFTSAGNFIHLGNGDFLLLGNKPGTRSLIKFNDEGTILQCTAISFTSGLIQKRNNGNLIWLIAVITSNEVHFHETDQNGVLLNSEIIPYTGEIIRANFAHGHLFISTLNTVDGIEAVRQYRFDENFNQIDEDIIWQGGPIDIWRMKLMDDGWSYVGYVEGPDSPVASDGFGLMIKTGFDGDVHFTYIADHQPYNNIFTRCVDSHTQGYIAVGSLFNPWDKAYAVKLDPYGSLYNNYLLGSVVIDTIQDCIPTSGEPPVRDWLLTAQKNGEPEFLVAITDENGDYSVSLDTGLYTLNLLPVNYYWNVCNNHVPLDFTNDSTTIIQDFAVESFIDCPDMSVNVNTTVGVPCETQPIYIYYCNEGTVVANDVNIELQLDNAFIPVSSTVPWTNLSPDNILTFDLGDVPELHCDTFTLTVTLDCAADIGLGYLIDAQIFPDTICGATPPDYSGAYLQSQGACTADSIYFEIRNIGQEPMDTELEYYIVEDAVLMYIDNVPLLDPLQAHTFSVPANGSTYTLFHDQVAMAPGQSNPLTLIQACGTNNQNGYSIGYSNQFPPDDQNHFVDIDWALISEDPPAPNNMTAFPKGYAEENYILAGTPIEYHIHFKNEGDALAHNLNIRCVLDENLDFKTFRKGSASHSYNINVEAGNTLVFEFKNILLPSSDMSQELAKGFISFTVAAKMTAPLGSEIINQAQIHFDNQNTILSDPIRHTIGQNYIEVGIVSSEHPTIDNIEVLVHPNPTSELVYVDIKNHHSNSYQLDLFDVKGVKINTQKFYQEQILIEAGQLPSGYYVYKLSSNDGFIHVGKIIVRR